MPQGNANVQYHLAIAEAQRQMAARYQDRARRWDVQERRVFISYTGSDRSLADEARCRLEARGIPSFAFDHDMRPGDEIVATIKAEIERSTHIVVVATATSMGTKPHWLSYELGLGDAARKYLLTLVLTPNLDLPDPFRRYRYVQGWDEFERYFDQPEFDPVAVEDLLTEVLGQTAEERAKFRPVGGATGEWERELIWSSREGLLQHGAHLKLEGPAENPRLTLREWNRDRMQWEYELTHEAALRALTIRPATGEFRKELGQGIPKRDHGTVVEYEPGSAIARTMGWRTTSAFWRAAVELLRRELGRSLEDAGNGAAEGRDSEGSR